MNLKTNEPTSYRANKLSGAVTLPSILLISTIIMEIAIVTVIISTALINSANSEKLSSEALKAARTGIEDATIRIVRYCSLAENASYCPLSYSITVGSRTAVVTIEALTPAGNDFTRVITATGTAGLIRKKLEATLNINGSSGETRTQSIREVGV